MIGENTKAAIRRIAEALPFLKAESSGTPIAQRGTVDQIRAKSATANSEGRDVQIEAAEAWVTEEIEKALAADSAPPTPTLEPEPEPTPEVPAEPKEGE